MQLWAAQRRSAGCDMAPRSSAALWRLLLLNAASRSETASLDIDKR